MRFSPPSEADDNDSEAEDEAAADDELHPYARSPTKLRKVPSPARTPLQERALCDGNNIARDYDPILSMLFELELTDEPRCPSPVPTFPVKSDLWEAGVRCRRDSTWA